MKHPLHNLHTEAQHIRLSASEKASMRARIFATSHIAAPSRIRTVYPYSWFSLQFAVPVAVLLVVVMGSGTVYAAEGSLPGDLLYPVKTNITEPALGALAVSPSAKVAFHTQVAQVRLEEAESLAARGTLDATVTQELADNIEVHVAQAQALTETIGTQDEGAAAEATARLDSTLAAHGSILAHIGDDSRNGEIKENSHALAQRTSPHGDGWGDGHDTVTPVVVATAMPLATSEVAMGGEPAAMSATVPHVARRKGVHVEAVAVSEADHGDSGAPVRIASSIAPQAPTSSQDVTQGTRQQKKVALQLGRNATAELSKAQSLFDSLQSMLDASTTSLAADRFSALTTTLSEGDTYVAQNDYQDARASYTSVLTGAIELETRIGASKKFNTDFMRSFHGEGEVRGAHTHLGNGGHDGADPSGNQNGGGESDN